jgi:phage tail sheath protein FI
MYAYRTPGVYFESLDRTPVSLRGLRTDITGFVGIAARGPLHSAVKIESWVQYVSVFGGHIPQGYLAYAVEGFFANGGMRCWVVRVADPLKAEKAGLSLLDDFGDGCLRLQAASEGVWSHSLIVTVLRVSRERFTLLLRHEDGGQELWPDLTMAVAKAELLSETKRPVLKLIGKNPLIWDEAVDGRITRVQVKPKTNARFDLKITLGKVMEENWENLSLDPVDPRYVANLLNASASGSEICQARVMRPGSSTQVISDNDTTFTIEPRYVRALMNDKAAGSTWVCVEHLPNLHAFPDNTPNANAPNLDHGSARLSGGEDGLSTLQPQHLAGESGVPVGACRGLGCLASVEEVSILAMPDIMPKPIYPKRFKPTQPDCTKLGPSADTSAATADDEPEHPPAFTQAEIAELQQVMLRQCERLKDRVSILDPLPEHLSREDLLAWRTQFDSSYAGFYFPWLGVPDPLQLEGVLRLIPPSGQVAGVYARGDHEVGVHKPPANAVVEAAQSTAVAIDDSLHAELNEWHVNVIRSYMGRGVRVSGARTLSSDGSLRYLNVRRLLLMIEQSIEEGTQDLVFETNTPDLWRKIERRVRAFLDALWRHGGLDGATADDAYSVRCDHETNPPQEIESGRVICEIGVLPPWPAEFIVVRIGFTQSGLQIVEEGR